jgi:ATP-binding cassette subfamily B protein
MAEPTLRERFSALGNLPAFFGLVWQTSPGLTLANAGLRLLRSAIPVAVLYVAKLIIDQVVAISQGSGGSMTVLWELVAVEFGLAILSDALGRTTTLIDSLLGDLFSNHTSVRIMQHAAWLDLEQFEDTTFYDKLERARQQTIGRTILLAQVLSQVQDLITMSFLAAGLVVFNPWLIFLLFLAVLPSFLGEAYFNDKTYALSRRQTPQRRELDYFRYIGASDETAKEVKLLTCRHLLSSVSKACRRSFLPTTKSWQSAGRSGVPFFSLLGTAGYYGAYVFIVSKRFRARLPLAHLLSWLVLSGNFAACSILCFPALPPYRRAPSI